MKTLLSLVLVALVAMPVMAEDRQVSNQSLAKMGLGKMVSVSDNEGSKVRGTWTFAFSSAFASGLGFTLPAQTSTSNPANTVSFAIGFSGFGGAFATGSASASTN